MSITQQMREQLPLAMKAKDAPRTQFLRYWISQFTLGDGSEVTDPQALKKMRAIVNEAKTGTTTFKPEEVAMIQEWIPPTLSLDKVRETLQGVADEIRKAPKDGLAMGVAMKALAGLQVESKDVKAVVEELRTTE